MTPMKTTRAFVALLASAVVACQSTARPPGQALTDTSGLEEVSIVSKGLE